jgi:hypothetical protein
VSKLFLRSSFLVLATKLQEAADLTASDVAARLSDQIQDMHRGTGHYANYHDHAGDDKSGDVIYSVDGNTVSAPYEMSKDADGAAKCFVHSDKATNVVPRTVYEPEEDQDELDEYARMTEAALYTRGPMPLVERKIAKSERDAAPSGSFAGKGKSFPILKAEDVSAAAHALGRAGSGNYSTDVIKRNIIRIAKEKGWTSELPKAWQDGDGEKKTESHRHREARGKKPMKDCEDCKGSGDCPTCDGDGKMGKDKHDCKDCDGSGDCDCCDGTGKVPMFAKSSEAARTSSSDLRLVESAGFCAEIPLVESARVNYPIKLISPGTGTMAHYPAKALEEAAPLFKPGTLMFWNHPTAAEDRARPEGDLNNLAAITTKPAVWQENGPKGPGLYAEAKVMADYADRVQERAPHIGLSIRAGGESTGRMINGKPELKKINYVESVDYVTKAGRGGLALVEAARNAGLLPEQFEAQESSMNAEEKALLQRLVDKDIRADAIREGARVLDDVDIPSSAKMYIIETVVDRGVPKKDGALDEVKLRESVNAEARRFGGAIGAGPRVTGMGAPAPVEITEAQRKAYADAQNAEDEMYKESWATLLDGNAKLAEVAIRGRAS